MILYLVDIVGGIFLNKRYPWIVLIGWISIHWVSPSLIIIKDNISITNVMDCLSFRDCPVKDIYCH